MNIQKLCLAGAILLSAAVLSACSGPSPQSQPSQPVSTVDFREEFLPIGSVVLLEGGNKPIMICGRVQAMAGSDEIYDYSACYYPEGILDPSSMFFFNRGDIAEVRFVGFEDQTELDYRAQLDSLGELEIRDGVIVERDP